ncbi:MAG: fused MFS/spermidine synthase [Planctomycetaceae bacterium]|nr:fused MFS/spermidine synthase [Planctomycetaceae bacterium]
MHLKRLEAFGFKSFADRMEFDFGRGVTGIVGPNGCGKSNVVDALKWALGDQRPTSVRGTEMADVLFAGSGGRKPLGLAEVSLTFDNADRFLPLDLDEVVLTRRLYRDGTSEYLLNRDQARLKDIRELFMDTGGGRGALAILEQGKIDAVLQENAVERRLVFEEAAGIARYRLRQKETQRRIEHLDENLLRLRDILSVSEKQLRSMRAQAGRAERYRALEESLRAKRVELGLWRYARLLEERESDLQYLAVREDAWPGEPPRRVLCINEGVYTYHALRVEGRVLTEARPYDDYSLIPFLLDLPPGAVLRAGVLGYACGVDAGQWRHFWEGPYRVEVLGAEIDGEVLALGRERFGAPEEPGVAEADGRPWLEALPEGSRMHFLVIDAFARELYVPFHLATREFFALCRRRLEPGGILAMNVYAVGASSPHLAALENTMASVFGSCLRASQHGGTNFLLLARNGEGPADLGRLGRAQARARFGERPGTAEWERLLDHGAALAADAAVVVPRGDLPVLTDDDAPLEWMTDRFLRENEDRILAEAGDSVAELRRLDRRQSWLLAGIALLGLGAGVILNPAQIIKRWAAPTRAGSGIGRA